jgi:hypothetical protein
MHDQNKAHGLYKKLLRLYPQAFRERLGESMEQTFDDLYTERKRQTDRGLFLFVFGLFIDTAIGILRERLLLTKEGDAMKNVLANLRSPAILSVLLVVPFMILEVVNRRNFNEGFPVPLFVILWLLPMLFILIVTPIVRNIQAGNSLAANPVIFLIRVVFLAFIVWTWFGIVID